MLHTDTLLVLDEIHAVEAKVLDSAIYALINGYGKSRGNIHAGSRPASRWRVLVLSSGEISSETQLCSGGFMVRSGQTIRMLDIPVEGKYGAFDSLHGSGSGAEFADTLRESASQHYGYAGPLFVTALIDSMKANLDLPERLLQTQKSFHPANEPQRRVARTFAILALTGELGAQWKLLPWNPGEALQACALLFRRWKKQTLANAAASPEAKILTIIATFIDRFGDDRFSNLRVDDEKTHVRDRAGYWEEVFEQAEGEVPIERQFDAERQTRRIYLFTAAGLREATRGYDLGQVTDVLKGAGAFYKTDSKQLSFPVRTPHGVERLYHIDPLKLCE
jgi:putative DNA primase/helicase